MAKKLTGITPEQITIHNCHGIRPAHFAWIEVRLQDGTVKKVCLEKLHTRTEGLARVAYDMLCLLAAELEGTKAE